MRRELSIDMFPEDGRLCVLDTGERAVTAFIESSKGQDGTAASLSNLIAE